MTLETWTPAHRDAVIDFILAIQRGEFGVPITAADQTVVGTMRLRFSDGNNGILEYSVNGTNVTKPITRIPFAMPVAACN